MPRHTCVVCGNTSSQDPSSSFHRFQGPNDARRARWLQLFGMDERRPIATFSSWKAPWFLGRYPIISTQALNGSQRSLSRLIWNSVKNVPGGSQFIEFTRIVLMAKLHVLLIDWLLHWTTMTTFNCRSSYQLRAVWMLRRRVDKGQKESCSKRVARLVVERGDVILQKKERKVS